MSLDRKVVGMVVARLNQLLLHRHVMVAPTPKPAVSFAADVARARAGTSLLTGLAGQLDVLERKSRDSSLMDELTGLYNRRFFYRQLVREVNRFKRYERPFTIVFAEIQESIPHPEETPYRASREALRSFAAVLRERIRNGVDQAFRLQGNEFAALLIDSGERQAAGVAVRLENAFSKLGFAGLTLKIGISEFSSDRAIHSVLSYAKKRLRGD
jgi:two-component system cell cycle response regulator